MNAFFKNLIPLKNSFQPQEGQKLEMKRVYTTVPANFFFQKDICSIYNSLFGYFTQSSLYYSSIY